jgi:hypothetical protein
MYFVNVTPPDARPKPGDLVKIDRNGYIALWAPGDAERCIGALPPSTRLSADGRCLEIPEGWPYTSPSKVRITYLP